MAEPQEEPCGSWRVTAYMQGYEETVRWCERMSGPCPFPRSDASKREDNAPCAVATVVNALVDEMRAERDG